MICILRFFWFSHEEEFVDVQIKPLDVESTLVIPKITKMAVYS